MANSAPLLIRRIRREINDNSVDDVLLPPFGNRNSFDIKYSIELQTSGNINTGHLKVSKTGEFLLETREFCNEIEGFEFDFVDIAGRLYLRVTNSSIGENTTFIFNVMGV